MSDAVGLNADLFDHTDAGNDKTYSMRLNGTGNEVYGLAKSLEVKPGDVVGATVWAKYLDPSTTGGSGTAFAQLIQDLSNNASTVVVDAISPGTQAMPSFVGLGGNGTQHAGAPKAYLNMMVFDRNYQQIGNTLYTQVSTAAEEDGTDVDHEFIPIWPITITEPGYVYIYLSNENGTPVEVFFDDFKVSHFPTEIVQKDDYYPFGLTFNSYASGMENNYKFNQGAGDLAVNAERQPELGWDMTRFRMYDYALGRFIQIDPKADQANQESWNPYQYAFNNPVLYNDPLGDTVRVTGSNEFKRQALTNLQALTDHALEMTDDGTIVVSETSCIDGCDAGNDLVGGLVYHDNTVTIEESTEGNVTKGGMASEANRKADGTPGTGVKNVTVGFNPNKKTGGMDENGSKNRPTEIGLGHELIHAENRMNGTRSTGSSGVLDPDGSAKVLSNEELNTRKAENRLRKEKGLPLRKIK